MSFVEHVTRTQRERMGKLQRAVEARILIWQLVVFGPLMGMLVIVQFVPWIGAAAAYAGTFISMAFMLFTVYWYRQKVAMELIGREAFDLTFRIAPGRRFIDDMILEPDGVVPVLAERPTGDRAMNAVSRMVTVLRNKMGRGEFFLFMVNADPGKFPYFDRMVMASPSPEFRGGLVNFEEGVTVYRGMWVPIQKAPLDVTMFACLDVAGEFIPFVFPTGCDWMASLLLKEAGVVSYPDRGVVQESIKAGDGYLALQWRDAFESSQAENANLRKQVDMWKRAGPDIAEHAMDLAKLTGGRGRPSIVRRMWWKWWALIAALVAVSLLILFGGALI